MRVLPRGNFLIETGEIVQPALPAYLVSGDQNAGRATAESPRFGELAGVA